MQLVNASASGSGYTVALTPNTSWTYPFLPGEPGGRILYQQLAVCVASSISVASACCPTGDGTFITSQYSNTRKLNSSEVAALLNAKYPDRNNSNPGIGGAPVISNDYNTGNYTPANNVSSSNGNTINWCALPWNPMSNVSLAYYKPTSFQSGPYYGNTPESVIKWERCFNQLVPAGEVTAGRAAYACIIDDLRTGGTIRSPAQVDAVSKSGATVLRSSMALIVVVVCFASTVLSVIPIWYVVCF